MKLSKEKRNQLVLVGIVAVALVAGVWQLLIQASMRGIRSQNELAKSAETKLREAASFLASADLLPAKATTLSNALAHFESEMASGTDPYTWCVQLIRKAQVGHDDVLIQEVSAPQSPAAAQAMGEFPYQVITFGVRGRAHWEDLGRFVAEFENRYPMFSTRKLQLVPDMRREPGSDEAAEPTKAPSAEMLSFSLDVVVPVKPGT